MQLILSCIVFSVLFVSLTHSFTTWNKFGLPRTAGVKPLFAVSEVVSAPNLDEVLKAAGGTLVVIDYSTTWCGPCKVAYPKYVALSDIYKEVIFLKCVGDTSPEAGALMKREGVRSVPSFHVWKNAIKIDVINGARLDDLEQMIKDNRG